MTVIAGIDGAIDGISTVRRWGITSTADLQAAIASNTKGAPVRLAGNKDWNGTYSAYGHTPLKIPGDTFTFTGKFSKPGADANGAEGVARVQQTVITIDLEAGLPISHEVSFESNGILGFASDLTDFTDSTDPTMFSSIGTKIEIAADIAVPVFEEVTDFRTATLTLTRANMSYVSAATAGGTKRLQGNFDAQLSYSIYEGDATALIAVNTIKHIKLFVDATTYWELKWMRFGEASDIDVDREAGTLVGATMNCSLHGHTAVPPDGSIVAGFVNNPAAIAVWPPA